MSGFVYAIAADDGLVKIGYTSNLRQRLSHLRANNARRLTPIGAIKATLYQEATLHQLLAEDNEKGEWFRRGYLTEHFLSKLPPWPLKHRVPKDQPAPKRKRQPAPVVDGQEWRGRICAAMEDAGLTYRLLSPQCRRITLARLPQAPPPRQRPFLTQTFLPSS
jgi:hypothetical protein